MKSLNWTGVNKVEIDGIQFHSTVDPAEYHKLQSSNNNFLLVKSREMIERELQVFLNGRATRNVVDIGIWQGGSVVLLDLLLDPDRLVGIEYNSSPIPALSAYIDERRRSNISIHYGINQGATEKVVNILDRNFGDKPIDLVIDDASHQYLETKKSFEAIFPRLAPGAHFIIEDWQWIFNPDVSQLDYFKGKPALANLVVEIISVVGSRKDIIADITILPFCVIVTRGSSPYSKKPLNLNEIVPNQGAPKTPFFKRTGWW
jgi:hypothetical protein